MRDDATTGGSSSGELAELEERARIVAEFERVLARNRGRIAVPESELPASRDRVRQALLANAEAEAQGGSLPKRGKEFYKAALVELETFVSDRNARLLEDYENAKSGGEQWPPEEREGAERVLRLIQARQAQAIATWIRPDDLERTPTLMALAESPVVIGKARKALDAVAGFQEWQAAGWIMTFLDIGAAAAAFVIHQRYKEHPGAWLVALYVLPILLIGGPLWMALCVPPILRLVSRVRLGRFGHAIARTLVLSVGMAVPAAVMVLPTLYLFSRSSASAAGSSSTSATVVPGRCTLDLEGTVTEGADTGLAITGRMKVTITTSGNLSGTLVEKTGTSMPASGSVIQDHELGLGLDFGGGNTIAGTLAPFTGCSDTTAAGTFTGPHGWNTQHVDRGNWSVVRATDG